MTHSEREEVEKLGHVTRYPVGSILFGAGELTDFVLFLRHGHVKITTHSPEHIVAVRGPGETVGEMAAIGRESRSASVYALSEVEALYLPGDVWLDFLYEHPRVMRALLRHLHARLKEATRKQAEHGIIGAEQRLARGLVELAAKIGTPDERGVCVALNQRELAGLVGVSRESVSQVIKRLRAMGAVATGRQRIIITDEAVLTSVADGNTIS